ncbi:hypothetical protein IKG41_03000 [Candidatus Saccharibacteria bacterium]|nr:hypothetical protein [Candidatus Saccharibacteria bacterium]
MSRTNDNSHEHMQNKKADEYRSLDAAKKKLHFLKALMDISRPDQERPDFVFIDDASNRIGIEHFRIDISMGSRKNSGIKMTQGEAKKIFKKYHDNIEDHMEEARGDIEKILNCRMREWQNFDYYTFCENFKTKFNDHYSEVEAYKAKWNLSSIGFLIEFLVPDAKYLVSAKGESLHIQELCDFPITTEIWQILNDSLDKLDFIILDTNQHSRNKDSIVLIDKENEVRQIFKEFAPLFKGEKGKVSFNITS